MIIWNINSEESEYSLEMDRCALLVGQDKLWFNLVRSIDSFFNIRGSEVQIDEGAIPIQKKDWNCHLIPFDAQLQMDKVTAKSPLNDIIDLAVSELTQSPAYMELADSWEELQEETFFLNKSLEKYDVKASLNPFDERDMRKFISLSGSEPMMKPIEYKQLLLRLIAESSFDKKTLIILELPEIFSTDEEMYSLSETVEEMQLRGFTFIIITDHHAFSGNRNLCVKGKIVNEASLEMTKRRIFANAPFGVEIHQYEEAKEHFLEYVDNPSNRVVENMLSTELDSHIQVLIFMMFKELDIDMSLDLHGLPENIAEFARQY